MGREYEIQVLDINKAQMRKKLKEIGGKRIHKEIKMYRAAFARCNGKVRGFARVRNEGKTTTMTVKVYDHKKYPTETEVSIKENYAAGLAFLKALNLDINAEQETIREKWALPIKGVHEITFDTWPGLPSWMEVDCSTHSALNTVISRLKIPKNKMDYGSSARKYHQYYGVPELTINEKTPKLTFKNIHKEIKPRKKKELFKKICKEHHKLA